MKYGYALALVVFVALMASRIRSDARYQSGVMITYQGMRCFIVDRRQAFLRWSYKLQDISGNMIGWVPEEELDGI